MSKVRSKGWSWLRSKPKAKKAPDGAVSGATGKSTSDDAWQDELLPWLAGSIEWSDRYGKQIDENRFLKRCLVLAAVLIAFTQIRAYELAHEPTFLPYLVSATEHGPQIIQPAAPSTAALGEQALLSTIAQWIVTMRSVMETAETQNLYVLQTYARLSPDTHAITKANGWFQEHNPFQDLGSKRVQVEVTRTYSLGSDTQVGVDWIEESTTKNGVTKRFYSAVITVAFGPVPSEDNSRRLNPIGLFVTDFTISDVTKSEVP